MNRGSWKGMLISCVLLLFVLAVSVPFVESGTPAFAIIQLSAIHLVVAILLLGSFLYFNWDPIENLFR